MGLKPVKLAVGGCAVREGTLVRFIRSMHIGMASQMSTAHKAFIAMLTLEWFVVSLY